MQLWLCCALLVSMAGGCLAQKPRPCRSPPLYEGSFSMVAQNGNSQALGKFSYDAMSQRIRLRVFERDGNYSMVMDTLLLYREQVLYQIDYEHKTCLKQALMGEFHPLEIPPNSTFLAQTVLGSLSAPGEGVLVNSWAGVTHKDQGLYVMTYTEFGCLPVAVLFNGPTSDLVVSTYFNNVRGIEDPSVFIPPSFCENATLEAGKGTPPLFEGSFSVLAQNGDYLALGEYSYDAILQRVYFGEVVAAENYTKVPGILLLYQEKVMYLMDYKQQTCKKQALTSKFSPMEVPANASLLAQVVLGSLSASGEGVLVNTWTGDLPEVQGQYVMTFTEFGCFPVSALYRMPKMDLILYNLFNNVRGIKDPSVFIPPPFCEHATVKPGEGNIFSAFF